MRPLLIGFGLALLLALALQVAANPDPPVVPPAGDTSADPNADVHTLINAPTPLPPGPNPATVLTGGQKVAIGVGVVAIAALTWWFAVPAILTGALAAGGGAAGASVAYAGAGLTAGAVVIGGGTAVAAKVGGTMAADNPIPRNPPR